MAANTYAESWRAWDERYADLVIGKRNWQLAAGGLLIVSIILAAGHGVAGEPAANTSSTRCRSTSSGTRWRKRSR